MGTDASIAKAVIEKVSNFIITASPFPSMQILPILKDDDALWKHEKTTNLINTYKDNKIIKHIIFAATAQRAVLNLSY